MKDTLKCKTCKISFRTLSEQYAHWVECHGAYDPRAIFSDRIHNIYHAQVKWWIEDLNKKLGQTEKVDHYKRWLFDCTKECGFVLKDKKDWVDEIMVHVAVYHWFKVKCTKCNAIVFNAYLPSHLESDCRAYAFMKA